jgi:hypothetical protein
VTSVPDEASSQSRLERAVAWGAAFGLAWLALAVMARVWRGAGLPLATWLGIPLVIALTVVTKRVIDERGE